MKREKIFRYCVWGLVLAGCFIFLQSANRFNFLYSGQKHLNSLWSIPYAGALSVALLVTLVVILADFLFRKLIHGAKGRIALTSSLAVIALAIVFFSYKSSLGKKDLYKELDWYMYKDRPDDIIRVLSKTRENSYVYQNFLNWALARKGTLGDEMFKYPQTDPYSLLLEWREIAYTSLLLSNIYYEIGHISLAQRMAFEANVIFDNSNPRMLQRLIQTNLIFGQYDVAEKYITRLEKSYSYRKWANDQRKFLRNREMILQDPELGPKARCVPLENNLSLSKNDLGWDLEEILRANPYHSTTREYAGAHYLLAKNLQAFKEFIDEFMDGQPLPKSYKEAILILSEKEPALVEKWKIDQKTIDRYSDFKEFYTKNSRRSDLRQKLRSKFGDTYWLYYLYNQSK
ncbi:MAG: hypothetical protein IKW89_01165 [Bacteroidales bacterium]|nr:hypothetical protein [Bacteroidales bacterium]